MVENVTQCSVNISIWMTTERLCSAAPEHSRDRWDLTWWNVASLAPAPSTRQPGDGESGEKVLYKRGRPVSRSTIRWPIIILYLYLFYFIVYIEIVKAVAAAPSANQSTPSLLSDLFGREIRCRVHSVQCPQQWCRVGTWLSRCLWCLYGLYSGRSLLRLWLPWYART